MSNQLDELKQKVNSMPPNQAKNISLGAALISVISVFFPWVGSSSSGFGHSFSLDLPGYVISGGQFGLILGLIAIYGITKNKAFVLYLSGANVLIGLGYIFNMFGNGFSYSGGGITASVDTKMGLYIFLFSSIVLTAMRFLRRQESDDKQ
jgi:hypothetical protein